MQSLATNKYERALVSEVVLPDEIGVKFEDVGALVYVKDVLNEVVIFPMTRPDLFSHGDLRRVYNFVFILNMHFVFYFLHNFKL